MYKHNDPCLAKVEEDEPIFVLRAQDKFAPEIVRAWAENVDTQGGSNQKVEGAYEIASKMEEWQEKTGRRKLPD